jgi:hypothetical protein
MRAPKFLRGFFLRGLQGERTGRERRRGKVKEGGQGNKTKKQCTTLLLPMMHT